MPKKAIQPKSPKQHKPTGKATPKAVVSAAAAGSPVDALAYERRRELERSRQEIVTRAGQDIGELPPVANAIRRGEAEGSFRRFCESYFPQTFSLAWSPDHLLVIDKIETAVRHGGLFAMAMPRGSGKTTLAECAALWSILTGAREFVLLIGGSEPAALQLLDSIKSELINNDLLLEDWPEACMPFAKLEGSARRCEGQRYQGERTQIVWAAKEIVFAMIPGAKCSGAIVKVIGIEGHFRGMKHKRPDGQAVRPSLVIVDDPQTDESAKSPSQCATRERILAGAVLGLAGPGRKISGVMPCTVIRGGDLADRLLDRALHPEWNGERTQLVYSFPTNEKLWEFYSELRAESLRQHGDIRLATEFYLSNRAKMDEGAVVAWPERFNPDEASAIQYAMNLRLMDERAFFAEYQNKPLAEERGELEELSAEQIAEKVNGLKRGVVPVSVNHLTMFVDVQQSLLFWLIAGWESDFTGYVIDYGTWPEQQKSYFTLREAHPTLGTVSPKAGVEGAIYAGLEALMDRQLARAWKRDDGADLRVERVLIDANWSQSTDLVYQFCRQSSHSAVLYPSHGKGVGAAGQPFGEYRKKPGDRVGLNWRIPSVAGGKRTVRHVLYDTNWWKSFVHARLAVAMGDRGCLSLWGDTPVPHRLISYHLTAEFRVRTEGRGRTVDEWKLKPEKPDNHWFDCLVGAAVAASIQGVALPDVQAYQAKKKESKQWSERQVRIW